MASISFKLGNGTVDANVYNLEQFNDPDRMANIFSDRVADLYALVTQQNYNLGDFKISLLFNEEGHLEDFDTESDYEEEQTPSKNFSDSERLAEDVFNKVYVEVNAYESTTSNTFIKFIFGSTPSEEFTDLMNPFIETGCVLHHKSTKHYVLDLTKAYYGQVIDVSKAIARDLEELGYEVLLLKHNLLEKDEVLAFDD